METCVTLYNEFALKQKRTYPIGDNCRMLRKFWMFALLLFVVIVPALAQRTVPIIVLPQPPKVLPKVEFLRDIAPILDKGSCSVAECHGKFGGRGGLQMSLLTLSPEDDYEPIVYGERGRRINFAKPEQSLFLLKSAGQVTHGGGLRFPVNSPHYNTLLRWIQEGASFDAKDPRLVTLKILPEKTTIATVGGKQPIRAVATYTDGSTRDVTAQTVFSSTNDAVLKVSPSGTVTGTQWGGGAILGRYLGTVSAAFFTIPQARKGKYLDVPTTNVIDKLVFDNLKRMNVVPSALSMDADFLRRVMLDTLGRLPNPDEIQAFIADTDKAKRTKKIDLLLNEPEFADFRALRLADLLRVHPRKLGNGVLADRAATLFYNWIWQGVRDNKPYDQFVRELITARGSTYQNGPANFYRIERAANDRMENLGQAFLGVRMSCARCHKHPFDKWNTDDYWNFSAFMAKVGINGGRLLEEEIIVSSNGAELRNDSVAGRNRGKIAPATYLGEHSTAPANPDMIAAFADWMTDAKNPFFARATVNRLWSHYFGRGIINPVDDMRNTTPESVPGLIDALALELTTSKYNIQHVIRLILNSRTYQLSAIPNASNLKDTMFFSRFAPKPMPAQALLDMINQAAGIGENFGTYPERTRAVQAAIPPGGETLDSFGISHREFLADIDPKLEPTLVQTLHLINSPYLSGKISNGKTVAETAKDAKTDEELVTKLFLKTFSRPPNQSEITGAIKLLKTAPNRAEGTADLLWALITSREFYFNH